jgi:hypothetical protein
MVLNKINLDLETFRDSLFNRKYSDNNFKSAISKKETNKKL